PSDVGPASPLFSAPSGQRPAAIFLAHNTVSPVLPAVSRLPGRQLPARHVSPTVHASPSHSSGSHAGMVVEVVAAGSVALVGVVVLFGNMVEDVRVVVVEVVVVGASMASIAARASIRPNPAVVSKPTAPMSTAVDVRALCTSAGERVGFLLRRRAANAEGWGWG